MDVAVPMMPEAAPAATRLSRTGRGAQPRPANTSPVSTTATTTHARPSLESSRHQPGPDKTSGNPAQQGPAGAPQVQALPLPHGHHDGDQQGQEDQRGRQQRRIHHRYHRRRQHSHAEAAGCLQARGQEDYACDDGILRASHRAAAWRPGGSCRRAGQTLQGIKREMAFCNVLRRHREPRGPAVPATRRRRCPALSSTASGNGSPTADPAERAARPGGQSCPSLNR